jgi:hypothetical protein
MGTLPLYILVLWACSALLQLITLILIFANGSFRKLPFFTMYVALNLCQVAFLVFVYSTWGSESGKGRALAWYSECVTLLAQALATTEILKVTLRPYQGIWGLAWRALAFTSALVVLIVALATYGDWGVAGWFELNRGYHLTFAAAVIACLLLFRYYSVQVPDAYKRILGGFCLYSCTEILIHTVLQSLARKWFDAYQPIWQSSTMLSFIVILSIWVAALWKPLPIEAQQAAPPSDSIDPSDSVYQRLSPEINERLRELNEKLLRLWKLEARPQ